MSHMNVLWLQADAKILGDATFGVKHCLEAIREMDELGRKGIAQFARAVQLKTLKASAGFAGTGHFGHAVAVAVEAAQRAGQPQGMKRGHVEYVWAAEKDKPSRRFIDREYSPKILIGDMAFVQNSTVEGHIVFIRTRSVMI